MYFWVAPVDVAGVKNVYVDRIFIEKQPPAGERK
jgi:hypothetical protein